MSCPWNDRNVMDGAVTVGQLKANVEIMLYSFPGAPAALVNEAIAWFSEVTKDGMPEVERILEVRGLRNGAAFFIP